MDQTASVAKLTVKPFVLVYQLTWEAHQDVDLNVFLVPNALRQNRVVIKNASIHALEFVGPMPFAEWIIIVQFAPVISALLAIPLQGVIQFLVSSYYLKLNYTSFKYLNSK